MSGFVFSEKPIGIERGEGVHLYDTNGNEYLDFGASYACTPVGHCHPEVIEAATGQLEQLVYVQASYSAVRGAEGYDAWTYTNCSSCPVAASMTSGWQCPTGVQA